MMRLYKRVIGFFIDSFFRKLLRTVSSIKNYRFPIERRVPRGGIQVRSAYCSGFGRT
jgi:hypothetical protein